MRFDALTAGPAGGELVLLLHGFPQNASCWRDALASLGHAGFRAVAPSQRGYSAAAYPVGVDAYRVSELCDDVLAMVSSLGAKRFHVIGHDWGGTVAWALAGEHPDAVISLCAVSTPHSAALRDALRGTRQRMRMAYVPILRLPRIAESLFEAGGGVTAESLLMAAGLGKAHAHQDVAALRTLGPTGALNWYRALGMEPAHFQPVKVPVLYVWGDRDPVFTREAAELTAEYCTGDYHLLELDGGSHWIPEQQWDDVADVVLEHLTSHPAGN
jgi:pimeloyl-ACP methyl ester carboxylesterase